MIVARNGGYRSRGPVHGVRPQAPRILSKLSAPPPNGSTGSITDGSTSTAGTSRRPNWKPPTTVNTSPTTRSGTQKQSDRSRRGDSRSIADAEAFVSDEEVKWPNPTV